MAEGGPPGTGWGQPKKKFRTVDGPLLHVVMKAYNLHLFFSLDNLNNQKILKHSNTRLGKAQLSTRAPCSVHTQRAVFHRQQHRTELSFASSCTWTNKYKSQFKHANTKICEGAQFSNRARCSVRTGRAKRDSSQSASTLLLTEFICSLTIINQVKPKIIQTPNIIFLLFY